jgi:hypothetical protein
VFCLLPFTAAKSFSPFFLKGVCIVYDQFGVLQMADLIESLCGKMTLTDGEKVGISITDDETTNLRMKSHYKKTCN